MQLFNNVSSATRVACHVSVFVGAFWLLLYLLFSTPRYSRREELRKHNGACPPVWGQRLDWSSSPHSEGVIEIHQRRMALQKMASHNGESGDHTVNCQAIVNGDRNALEQASKLNWCDDNRPEQTIYTRVLNGNNCDRFKEHFGYTDSTVSDVSDVERDFPIAFSILTYEDIHQSERLLHAVYKPHNIYCVHVDSKADSSLLDNFIAIAKCLPNVIVPQDTINVHWAEYSVLEAELLCMDLLVKAAAVKWKYYINLTGREFPLKTNLELVNILKVYNGGNDIDGNMYK